MPSESTDTHAIDLWLFRYECFFFVEQSHTTSVQVHRCYELFDMRYRSNTIELQRWQPSIG